MKLMEKEAGPKWVSELHPPSSTGVGVSYRLIVEMEMVAVNKGLLINEGVGRRRSLLEPVRRDVPPINTALRLIKPGNMSPLFYIN